jgi:hypothetical protein
MNIPGGVSLCSIQLWTTKRIKLLTDIFSAAAM